MLDSLSITDILQKKDESQEEKVKNGENVENQNLEKIEEKDKNDDMNKNMDDNQQNEDNDNENIFEEIKEFISFDKNKDDKKMNNIKIINKNNFNVNNYNTCKYSINNNYINQNKYENELRNKFCHFPNNIKTVKACSPERNYDSFDNYPPLLEKNSFDKFDYNNTLNKTFIRNNIYKNQQFQANQLFNFKKQYEENPFLLEQQYQTPFPPYYLQKTIPFPSINQNQFFPYNSYNSNSFFSGIPKEYNQFNYPLNTFSLLKTTNPQNNNFIIDFNIVPPFTSGQIKNEGKFNYTYEYNNNSHNITPNVSKEKKQKEKTKLFLRNNKLVYVINEKHTDTKDAIYLDEDSESSKNGKIPKKNKLNILQEKFAEKRKPRSSKYRGVSKNGKHWQVLIMIKKKKRYIGNFIEEEEAAREYDKIAIQFHGPKAKTNFQYSKEEINSILSAPKLQKLSNLF